MALRPAIFCAILSLTPSPSMALGEFHATYELAVGALTVGEMSRTFEVDANGAYKFVSTFETTGLAALLRKEKVYETSSGSIIDGTFVPDHYTYVRKSKKKPRKVDMRFNREKLEIETVVDAQRWTAALAAGVLDKLVYQAALMEDLAAGRQELEYLIADRGKEKTYRPEIQETGLIDTRLGQLETIKVVRESKNSKKKTVFWCASKLDFLPVRVLHRNKDGSETIVSLIQYKIPTRSRGD
jgi:hypothetical protein